MDIFIVCFQIFTRVQTPHLHGQNKELIVSFNRIVESLRNDHLFILLVNQSVLDDSAVKTGAADPENFTGLAFVPTGTIEHLNNVFPLNQLQ